MKDKIAKKGGGHRRKAPLVLSAVPQAQLKENKNQAVAPTSNPMAASKYYGVDDVVVDPELKAFLGVRPEEDTVALEASILSEGARDPIDVWMRGEEKVVLDGHTRHGIFKKHDIKFRISIHRFADIDQAKAWMVGHQNERRNNNPSQFAYLIGFEYELLKRDKSLLVKYLGGQNDHKDTQKPDNQHINDSLGQNNDENAIGGQNDRLAEILGRYRNRGEKTVRRFGQFYVGMERIRKHSKEFFKDILAEKINIPSGDIELYAKLEHPPKVSDKESLREAVHGKEKKKDAKIIHVLASKAEKALRHFKGKETEKNKDLAQKALRSLIEKAELELKKLS